jgi:hypothetical protein
MKSIANYLILERNHSDSDIQQYTELLNLDILKDVSVQLSEAVIKRCAGYIVEEYVKVQIKQANGEVADTFVDGEFKEYYDFELKGDKFEVKAFQKGRKYSNTRLTTKQQADKDNLIFIFVEYVIDGAKIKINNVSIEDGKNIKYDNKTGRLMK